MWVTLLAGSLFTRDNMISPHICELARHLSDADRHLRIRYDGLGVWWPTSAEIEQLNYLLGFRDADSIREFVLRRRDLRPVHGFRTAAGPPPGPDPVEEFCRADKMLHEVLTEKRFRDPQDRREILNQVTEHQALGRELVVEPLLAEALCSQDPVDRLLGVQVAECAQRLQAMSPAMCSSTSELLEAREAPPLPVPHGDKRRDDFYRQSNLMLRLIRERRRNK
jgi:hypothetical protein